MELEQFYVFEIVESLSPEKRAIIEKHIEDNAVAFGQNVVRSWHKRAGEDFLRILVEPVVMEIVFFSDRIELYGAAPTWARLHFTAARKEELRQRIEEVLLLARFTTAERLEAQKQKAPKRKLFARARAKVAES